MAKKGLLIGAIATLTGTAIGAGFLGIPGVIAKSGFLIGALHIVALGLIMMFINLCIGEVSLRTKGNHQLPGYAKKYLGKIGAGKMFFAMIFGIYAALAAYILGEGQSLSFVIFGTMKYSLIMGIAFFVVMAALIYTGIVALKKGETFGLIAVISIVILISIFFIPKISAGNLTYGTNGVMNSFLPFGVVLFSFLAFSVMPELEKELKGNERMMKKAIIIGSLIPIVLYLLFAFVTVGFAGKATPEIATFVFGRVPTILAVFTMFTAFFALSMALRDMYILDMKLKKNIAVTLTCFVPFALFLAISRFGGATFSYLLELSGVISGGFSGVAIVLMLMKAKKMGDRKPEYSMPMNWLIIALIALLFAFGILYQFIFR